MHQKRIATVGVVVNLGLLAFFKYGQLIGSFFIRPATTESFLLSVPLPIGISFFTFEGISLLVDVYRGNVDERKHLVSPSVLDHCKRTLLFISFFPHLIAGPILKAHDFLPQIHVKTLGQINVQRCFRLLVTGYFLKMVVADNLKDFTFWIAYPYFQSYSSVNLLVMLFGYSCQIFADFAGYSLIAIGLASLFGYEFNPNFNFPYIATSFKDFWKRWHISLSTFLMEYLYIPLGGNRKGELRTYLNLLITMFLGGLWHGAAWSYAIWGLAHGLALAVERFLSPRFALPNRAMFRFASGALVFGFVSLAWLLFKLPNFSHVMGYFSSIAKNKTMAPDFLQIFQILLYSSPVVLYHAHYLFKYSQQRVQVVFPSYVYYAVMLFFIALNSGNSGDFIYFQF
ncbi:MBOAT family O-acyltransferase [Spirosoma validum]|uniref:MBOAT family O-acyltransferase n=1 Tax=Spirosoma validum TaxID=2771355 RepID=UPI00293BA081|nr:MBOAT family O-acyltransferase [Spirosoma validum]